jgi:drug/metabolite transporter (DMT)-like permease
MPPTALVLLLIAAILHAGWNFFVKRAHEKQVFTWWGLVIGSLCFIPLLVVSHPFPVQIWPYVICSALVEGVYYIVLTRAYDNGDFSLVYPMARGTAPAFLLIWTLLFLGERPHLAGLAGIALIVCSLIVIGGKTWWSLRKSTALSTSAIVLALTVAFCISIYSAIDGAAVHIVAPIPYTILVISLSTVFVTPVILTRYGRQKTLLEWRTNWLLIILVGILMMLSYMLVLITYSFAHVSYAGAIREISVVFAAFMGWRWLGEDFGLLRLLGACLIFVGVLVIAVAG